MCARAPRLTDACFVGSVGAAVVALGAPAMAQAQSAIIYGSLSNFDIANDTGKTCHGFEVQLEGLTPAQYAAVLVSLILLAAYLVLAWFSARERPP